jgi:hypothetical protein
VRQECHRIALFEGLILVKTRWRSGAVSFAQSGALDMSFERHHVLSGHHVDFMFLPFGQQNRWTGGSSGFLHFAAVT